MRVTDTEAIVLGAMDYGESDRIVTLFCREWGKVRVMARHGKASRKRFSGALEAFALLQVRLVLKEGLSNLSGADVVTVFPRIRGNLAAIGHAGYACELIDRFLPDALANARLYRLFSAYLEHLDRNPPTSHDRRFFEVNLLNILGYRPSLARCSSCGGSLHGDAFFSAAGEVLCAVCGGAARPVGSRTLTLLGQAMGTGRFGVIRFPEPSLAEAGQLLDAAIASHLGRPLNSLRFLDIVPDIH